MCRIIEDKDSECAKLIRFELYKNVAKNSLSAKKELISLIREHPESIDAYKAYWEEMDS